MKIEIPRVVQIIPLMDYAEEFGDAYIEVWVNPSRELLRGYYETLGEIKAARVMLVDSKSDQATLKQAVESLNALGEKVISFLATLWSQGAEDTRWTPEEVRDLFGHCQETDPGLWSWLIEESLVMINLYRAGQKKASKALSGI